jgi:hypothetical protein
MSCDIQKLIEVLFIKGTIALDFALGDNCKLRGHLE